MATFQVHAHVTISIFATVEADSEEEAREKAEELVMPSLCYGRSSQHENGDTWGASEFDGEACDIRVEEATP